VERIQQTILDECWKPAFARYLIPKQTGLRLDLGRYLRYYDTERAHTGRRTKGRTPDQVLGKAKLWHKNTDGSPQPGTGQANEPPSTAHSRPSRSAWRIGSTSRVPSAR
jgi:hypothetical protein